MSKKWDAIVIGAGPAGASCAVWLQQLGFEPLLIEAREQPGGLLCTHSYQDIWTITSPDQTGQEMAAAIARQIEIAGVSLRCQTKVVSVDPDSEGFVVTCKARDGSLVKEHAHFVVVAGGVSARVPPGVDPDALSDDVVFGPGDAVMHGEYKGLSIAVLGGGDNAFENYLYVKEHGARQAHLYARTVRAQQQFVRQVPDEDLFLGPVVLDLPRRMVNGQTYDRVLVFYGWEPNARFLEHLPVARDERGFLEVDTQTAQTSLAGLYAIGEVTQRMHPCVPTAMADGVVAAKAIEVALGLLEQAQ